MPIWNAVMVSLEGVEIGFALGMIPLHAVIQWDLGETNILMFMLINLYECCWKSFSSLYSWLRIAYDRRKLWKILFDVRNHKLDVITLSLKICKQWLLFGLMGQVQIYHQHQDYNGKVKNDMRHWFSNILVQLVSNFKLIPVWSFSKLVTLPNTMRAIIEVYWRIIFIGHGLFNFVFDRGKFNGCKISTLRTRLFEGVGIDENMDQILDYVNNGPNQDFGGCMRGRRGLKRRRRIT
jgi:hypothetical protein